MIQLPPSKSIGARYLVATFFNGTLPADPIFDENDDLFVLQQALLEIYSDEEPIDYGDSPIDVEASGTALRFVTAVCASSPGADYVITGTPRLMQRPMTPLFEVLKKAGAEIETFGENASGPYRVTGKKIEGGSFSIPGNISSQFISALMLVAPYWEKGLSLQFSTPLVSAPYIEMTARLMQKFGVELKLSDLGVNIKPGKYRHTEEFEVEADWSSASFFYEACVLGGGELELSNLPSPEASLQGDSATAEIFGRLGVLSSFDTKGANIHLNDSLASPDININFKDFPDLVLPFAVACLFTGTKFRFNGVEHLRLKESDRIASLQSEARKLGFQVVAGEDFISYTGEKIAPEEKPVIDPHDDHRVAMAFAMAALKTGEIKIQHPEVVEKSFIDFWNQLPQIGLQCEEAEGIMTITRK